MSAQNGERARFNRNRKRRNIQRQRLHGIMVELLKKKTAAASEAAAQAMVSEGGGVVAK